MSQHPVVDWSTIEVSRVDRTPRPRFVRNFSIWFFFSLFPLSNLCSVHDVCTFSGALINEGHYRIANATLYHIMYYYRFRLAVLALPLLTRSTIPNTSTRHWNNIDFAVRSTWTLNVFGGCIRFHLPVSLQLKVSLVFVARDFSALLASKFKLKRTTSIGAIFMRWT